LALTESWSSDGCTFVYVSAARQMEISVRLIDHRGNAGDGERSPPGVADFQELDAVSCGNASQPAQRRSPDKHAHGNINQAVSQNRGCPMTT
jgi:hypothetical protein